MEYPDRLGPNGRANDIAAAKETGSVIEVSNIKKSFGSNQVLKGVSLKVEKGDVVVILGPSGGGKTTFLRCLNFLEKADEGTFRINDQVYDLKKVSKKDILQVRRETAFVFQNYNLFKNKTALENVMEGLVTARKMPKAEAQARAKEALDNVGLSDRYDYYPANLSGGQQQRVGIARAIVLNPEVILFDEPTSSLDPELVADVLDIMKKVAKTGVTMIVVTHEMSFASDVANKVVFLDEGRIIEEGPPERIFSRPEHERTRQFLRRIIPDFSYVI